MSDTMSGQLLEGWSMVSAILFFFFWFFEVFAIFPKMQKASKNQKKTKCQTLCLASSWKGGPWCLPFCFFFCFFGFSRFLPSSQKCKKLRKTKKNKKNKMSDTMSGQLLEGWSMVSAIFFLFFEVFAIFPKMQKASKNQKKTKKKQNVRHYVWPALGRVVHGVCHFVFFFVFFGFSRFLPSSQKCKKLRKTKKQQKKTKCQTLCLASSWKGGPWCLPFCVFCFFGFSRFLPSMSGQLLEGWSMVSDIFFCFFFVFQVFVIFQKRNQCKTKLFKADLSNAIVWLHQQPLDFRFSAHILLQYVSLSPTSSGFRHSTVSMFFWYADVLVPHLQRFDSCSLNLQYRYINLLLFQK